MHTATSTPAPDGLRLGTVLPTRELAISGCHDPAPTLALAVELDSAGVDSLWVGESVTARPRMDAYVLLGALASVTSRATIGAAVVVPALRSPVAWAHQVASIDRLAGGRLVLGIGSGFPGDATDAEFAALGVEPARRVSRTDDAVTAARALWAGGDDVPVDDPTGRFGFRGVAIVPPAVLLEGPPTWLATATPAGLRRCGERYDGWLPYPPDPGDYAHGLAIVREAAAAAGRDPDGVTPGLYVTVAIGEGDEPRRRLDDYCTAYYGAPSEVVGLVQGMVAGDLDHVTDQLCAYVDAGARHLVIRHATLDPIRLAGESAALRDALRTRYG